FVDGLQNLRGLRGFVGGDREADVGEPFFTDVLDDHVDVDVAVGDRLENLGGDAGLVGHAGDGDFGLVFVHRDAADDDVFHFLSFFFHDSPRIVVETAADFKHDAELFGELDRAGLHDLRAERGQLEHLVVGNFVELAGVGHETRVGRVDAVHVGVNLADIGFHGGGNGDGAEVAAAPAQGRDVAFGRDALKPGNDDGVARVEQLVDFLGCDVGDLRLGVQAVGDNARLRTGQRRPA